MTLRELIQLHPDKLDLPVYIYQSNDESILLDDARFYTHDENEDPDQVGYIDGPNPQEWFVISFG